MAMLTGNPPYSTSTYSSRHELSHRPRCGRGVVLVACVTMTGRPGALAPLRDMIRLLSRDFAAIA